MEAIMAAKEISVKKYVVRLSGEERERLETLIRKEKSPARRVLALACSKPPKGRARWTLRLLENKVVELNIVDHASDSTIGRVLKKTFSSRTGDSAGSSHRRPTARS